MKLWRHQWDAVQFARTRKNIALFFSIGTGKTGTMISILQEDYDNWQKVNRTMIFAPLSVCPQWKKEFARFSKVPEHKIHVLTQSGAKRTKELEKIREQKEAIIVTNYEGLGIQSFYEQMIRFGADIVVLDESHRIKDSAAKRSKLIYPICHGARRRFLLTGTPVLNSLLDIYGQYRAMDPEIFNCNFWTFRSKYFYDKNAGMPSHVHFPNWQPKPEAAKLIGKIMAQTSLQAKTEDCLDLPPLHNVPVSVQLSKKQREAYVSMEKHFVAEIKNTVISAEFAMTKLIRLQQILAGFAMGEDNVETWLEENPRLNAVCDLLEGIGGSPTILWTTFIPTYKKLGDLCEKAGYRVGYFTGQETQAQKNEAKEAFIRGDINALVANPASAGTGLDGLQISKHSIYFAKSYSLDHYLQSQGRNRRAGSEIHDKITHFHLYAEGTVDEVINHALLNKLNVAETVMEWANKLSFDKAKEKTYPLVQEVTL